MRRYSKPQPLLMPGADSTLRQIAKWRHIITTDLPSAFYQIPPVRESMKYCGIETPFHGVCMPCQRWACLALKLSWRKSCVVYLRPYLRRSCCQDHWQSILQSWLTRGVTAELEMSAPGLLQVQLQTLCFQNLSSTPNLLWSWAGFGTLVPSRHPCIKLQP